MVVVCQDESIPSLHWDAIRAIAFSRDGKLFASAGDDKLVKLWDATSWHCLKTMSVAVANHDLLIQSYLGSSLLTDSG